MPDTIPIETESDALTFLTWLRQYKPNLIATSRNVAVSDFGRLILLNGAAAINLTLVTLTRSGSLKVALLSNFPNSAVVVPDGTINLETRSSDFDGINAIDFGADNSLPDWPTPKIVTLYYSHDLDKWYVDIEAKAIDYVGNVENASGISPDSRTLVHRSNHGSIHANQSVSISNTENGVDPTDNYLSILCFGTDNVIESIINGESLQIDFSHTGSCGVSFSSRVKAGGPNVVFVDAPATKYANDAAAAIGGVGVGEIYETTTNLFRARMA